MEPVVDVVHGGGTSTDVVADVELAPHRPDPRPMTDCRPGDIDDRCVERSSVG